MHECSLIFFARLIFPLLASEYPAGPSPDVGSAWLFVLGPYFCQQKDSLLLLLRFENIPTIFKVDLAWFRITWVETCVLILQTFLHNLIYQIHMTWEDFLFVWVSFVPLLRHLVFLDLSFWKFEIFYLQYR